MFLEWDVHLPSICDFIPIKERQLIWKLARWNFLYTAEYGMFFIQYLAECDLE